MWEVSPRKKRKLSVKIDAGSAIEKLNDDCLIQIFNLLSVAERIRVERVCKRWQEISKESWSKVKELDFHPENLGLKLHGKNHQYSKIYKYVVEKILKSCGRYLEKVKMTENFLFDYGYLVAIFCKNIQCITFGELTFKSLTKLSNNCKNIAELCINSYISGQENKDKVLAKLFCNNKSFKILKLHSFRGTGESLLNLPLDELEEIKIHNGSFSLVKNLTNVIYKSKKLKSFEFSHAKETLIRALAFTSSNLTILNLQSRSTMNGADTELSQVFKNNKDLLTITLDNFETLTGE